MILLGRSHSENTASALCNIAHDVAEICFGHKSLQRADRLKDCRTCLRNTCLESEGSRRLKRHFGGVNGVIRSVVKNGLETYHRVACHNTLLHALTESLFNRREVVFGN